MPVAKPYPSRMPKLLPPGGRRYSIDWSNPLTLGLEVCYLPGLTLVNIANKGFNLTPSRATPGVTKEGPALVTAGGTAGAASSFSATVPTTHRLITTTQSTVYWRGLVSQYQGGAFFGISYGNGDQTPYHVYVVAQGSVTGKYRNSFNTSGTTAVDGADSTTTVAVGTFASYAGTFNSVSQKAWLYLNGLQDAVGSTTISAQWQGSSTSLIVLSGESTGGSGGDAISSSCNIACIWTRELSAPEMASLDRDPYQFIVVDPPVWAIYEPGFWFVAQSDMQAAMQNPNRKYLRR